MNISDQCFIDRPLTLLELSMRQCLDCMAPLDDCSCPPRASSAPSLAERDNNPVIEAGRVYQEFAR